METKCPNILFQVRDAPSEALPPKSTAVKLSEPLLTKTKAIPPHRPGSFVPDTPSKTPTSNRAAAKLYTDRCPASNKNAIPPSQKFSERKTITSSQDRKEVSKVCLSGGP